jgi:hypothetical protein
MTPQLLQKELSNFSYVLKLKYRAIPRLTLQNSHLSIGPFSDVFFGVSTEFFVPFHSI